MRARIVYEVIKLGNLIASPQIEEEDAGGGYVWGRIVYAWWYRPVMWLAFWVCR
jgi:hypothetical protein